MIQFRKWSPLLQIYIISVFLRVVSSNVLRSTSLYRLSQFEAQQSLSAHPFSKSSGSTRSHPTSPAIYTFEQYHLPLGGSSAFNFIISSFVTVFHLFLTPPSSPPSTPTLHDALLFLRYTHLLDNIYVSTPLLS